MNIVYIAKINDLNDENFYNYYFLKMPNFRKIYASKYKFLDDRIRSITSFYLLLKLLNDNKIKFKEEDFYTDKNNKLCLKNCPVYFNISHSKNYVLAAISTDKIGVDVEYINDKNDLTLIKDFLFNKKELKEFSNSNNQVEYFYKYWCLKESYLKCLGIGIKEKMNSIKINKSNYNFDLFKIDDYQFSICYKNKDKLIIKNIIL